MLKRTGGQGGFTLIELLIVMVILAILAGIVIVSVTGVMGTAEQRAYDMEANTIGHAVLAYFAATGSWPTTGATINIDGTDHDIIDMCELVNPSGGGLAYLEGVPRSCAEVAGDDNCDAGACDCAPNAHYIWAIDTATIAIHSACTEDAPNYVDGYRDVYP